MMNFIENNRDWFERKIKEEWTSRSGFWSFITNEVEEWKTELDNEDERYLSITIGYMMLFKNNKVRYCIEMQTLENIYDNEFLTMKPEASEKIDNAIKRERRQCSRKRSTRKKKQAA